MTVLVTFCESIHRDPEKLLPDLREELESLYVRFHRREFISPDPLEFLYHYEDPLDREVAGIVSSSLAYGRVRQILGSVSTVLRPMGRSPASFLMEQDMGSLYARFSDFRHRFTEGRQLAALLHRVGEVLRQYGSLQECFVRHCRSDDQDIVPALEAFTRELGNHTPCPVGMLLPRPGRGSACKRLNLFLRWMVRCDEIDPGGWNRVKPSRLIVPLDTHVHRFALEKGLTSRKQADLRTAREITGIFRMLAPEDPVRYDFALTRQGIRDNMGLHDMDLGCPG